MKLFLLAGTVAMAILGCATSFAKEATIGIYGIVDQVTFEPNDIAPTAVKLVGVFIVPVVPSSGDYKSPKRGYLYFRLPSGTDRAESARRDWFALKAVAGTGHVVGFTQYWVPNPNDAFGNPHRSLDVTVHTQGDGQFAEVYPLAHWNGVMQAGSKDDPNFEKFAEQCRNSSRH